LDNQLPDFIWIYDLGLFILPGQRNEEGAIKFFTLAESRGEYVGLATRQDTIPLMILTANMLIANARLKVPNYDKYWKMVLNALAKRHASSRL